MQNLAFRYRLAKADGIFAGFRKIEDARKIAQQLSNENQCFISISDGNSGNILDEFFCGSHGALATEAPVTTRLDF